MLFVMSATDAILGQKEVVVVEVVVEAVEVVVVRVVVAMEAALEVADLSEVIVVALSKKFITITITRNSSVLYLRLYYKKAAEKIRELEQKIASMEKYIKELKTSLHLQQTQSATKMALLSPSFCATVCLFFRHKMDTP